MRIALVHGFNVKDGGKRTVDMLAPTLEDRGHDVDKDTMDYGYHNLIKVRFNNRDAIARIAGALEQADAVVTHSNGGNYVMQAVRRTSSPIIIIHVSPALNRKIDVPPMVTHMRVMYSRHDMAVRCSRRFLWFGHPWGAMGAYGYKGQDSRVINEDHTAKINGHSDWFTQEKAPETATHIANILENL